MSASRSRLLGVAALGVLAAAGLGGAGWGAYRVQERSLLAAAVETGGDPLAGRAAMPRFGCPYCHTIPGVTGARGLVGPPLEHLANRVYVGGKLVNTPENLVRWLLDPPAVSPGTAMPRTGLDADTARDIAAYLYTLR